MSDATAQNPLIGRSYVDNYQPPGAASPTPTVTSPGQPLPPQPDMPLVAAPTPVEPVAPAAQTTAAPTTSETLEDQNIFDLLGVSSATDQEKEAFLDELQQVIWEDFLENDVELLLTAEELTQLRQLMGTKTGSDLEQQEAVVVFLEKLIPDLEEIMLEKALELKADMVRERIAGMREYYASQEAQLAELNRAEQLLQEDKWSSAAQALNAIT